MLIEPEFKTLLPQLFDEKPDSVVWFRPVWEDEVGDPIIDFEIEYANHSAGHLLGVPCSELVGTRLRSSHLLDSYTINLIFVQCVEVWNSGKSIDYNYYSPGFERYFNVQRSRIADGVLSLTFDRTRLVQNEIESERDRDLLSSIINASINGLFAVEAVRNNDGHIIDFRFLKCNKRFLQVVGKPEAAVIGQSYLSLLPSSKENGRFELMLQVLNSGESIEGEYYYQGEGIDGWFQFSIAPLGKKGVVETFTDITESKRDKEQLARSAAQFRTVVNSSKAGMFTLEPVKNSEDEVIDFRFGIVNQAVASYIGQTAEVLSGSLASVYFPAYTSNGLFQLYKDNYLTGTPYNFDFHYEDGYDVFFNIDVVKMGEEVLVTFTDHTALKRLQREQEQTVAELKRSNDSLEDFASAASHDLKEPIRKVHFFTERLIEKLDNRLVEEERELLARVETATARMQLLVDDLLEYAHVNSGQQKIEEVDLTQKLRLILTDLELMISEKQAVIDIGELPVVKGRRRQLQQLFHNLTHNALKYSKPNTPPVVRISSHMVKGEDSGINVRQEDLQKQFYFIQVSDNGIGFEQQYADRIFNIFTRLHGNKEYSGSGVGLSIVKKVVENHDGYIVAESGLGRGATFRLLLPAQ